MLVSTVLVHAIITRHLCSFWLNLDMSTDPYEDQFEKRNKEKKERVAKNELQRLRNIARNMKGKGELVA